MNILPYAWTHLEGNYFENFRTVRTIHRIDATPAHAVRAGPRVNHLEEIRVTLKLIISNHRNGENVSDDDILHLGIETPDDDGKFFWSRVGPVRLTVRDCLEGNGINTIIDYFAQRVQSNKNLVFGDRTIVTVYTFRVDA
ncbi:MAG: hypothetical protein GY816_06195 [Cytophagales bacterium]|nr:hypothetical protein [Cytophagales bacterium]